MRQAILAASTAAALFATAPFPARAEDPPPRLETTGYAEFIYYHPTNEYDPNQGIPLKERITARYALAGDVTVRHTAAPVFGRLCLFLPLGRCHPQHDYNYRGDPILIEVQPSLGYRFTPHLDARLTYNQQFDLGAFQSEDVMTPWFAVSARCATDRPVGLGPVAEASAFVEASLFIDRKSVV